MYIYMLKIYIYIYIEPQPLSYTKVSKFSFHLASHIPEHMVL